VSVDRAASPPVAHPSARGRTSSLQAFATALKSLVADSGFTSARSLAKDAHLSHETVAAAFRGKTLPTALVLDCMLEACGISQEQRLAWEAARSALAHLRSGSESDGPRVDPSHGHPDVDEYGLIQDHADPDDCGCFRHAVTAYMQRMRRTGTRNYLGWVELRYCQVHGAAWARFHGLDALAAVAARSAVDIYVAVHRASDSEEDGFHHAYVHDYHWSGLLLASLNDVYAEAQIFENGDLIGRADTRRLRPSQDGPEAEAPDNLMAAAQSELVVLRARVRVLELENEALRHGKPLTPGRAGIPTAPWKR